MSAGLTIAAVIFSSITAPLIINYLTQRSRRAEKAEDYRRQDEVAKRAEAAAKRVSEVAEQAKRAADLLQKRQDAAEAATEVAKEDLIAANEILRKETRRAASIVNDKLDQIHTLVNSNLLEAKQDRLTAHRALIVALKAMPDQSKADQNRIAILEATAVEYEAEIADRKRQTAVADAQVEQGEGGGIKAEWEPEEQ